jgi:hypothetical protein
MTEIIKSDTLLTIRDPIPPLKRFVLLLISFFPLLAPYQLLIQPRWNDYFNLVFLFVLVISLGALMVSGFFMWAAIAGINAQMRFNKNEQTFTFLADAPVIPIRTYKYPLQSILGLSIETHDWSEGAPSYALSVEMENKQTYSIGTSWQLEDVERLIKQVEEFLGSTIQRE